MLGELSKSLGQGKIGNRVNCIRAKRADTAFA
jgi:hypothetical protein